MSDETDPEIKKIIQETGDITGQYPAPLKTASKAIFVTMIRKNRKKINQTVFTFFAVVYCLLFWIVVGLIVQYIF